MSYSKPNQPIGSSRSIHSARIIAQTTVDARLNTDFEEYRDSFDYSSSIRLAATSSGNELPNSAEVTTAYLHQIQKSKAIQPFGCLLAIDEKTLKIIAYSENAPEMLTLVNQTVPSVGDHPVISFGTDVGSIFTTPSSVALQKAASFGDVSLLNPILVHCRTSGKPFYAIAHRVTHSLIIDFEPATPLEVPMTVAGALQSYKLAAKAISRLQSLPKGGMERLCNAMIQEVFELTGYDRVMIYKFHDDDHGEVAYEITKPGHEPYKGLHYPATDIPQAARFLFMRNKVRMIFDCFAKNVNVIQDEKLSFDLTLCGSTLRAPHTCHLQYMENMTSIASLVMAVVINNRDEQGETSDSSQPQLRKRLWGLVVCHNKTPRFVPFPMRYACEFLVQVFATHVNKELDLENQIREKNILHTQTLLCDMLMRDAPLSIVTKSPNIMDLVECDGASLLYNNKVWRLGLTPNDFQLRDIASWFLKEHMDSTGLSTDSLYDAGFSGASTLGDKVCGMAAVRITSKDMLFWFRTHRAAAIHWGGAKHEPGERDDGRKMNPRSSFKAFLDVVKMKSNPWKDYEMDAIHSLQLILRNTLRDMVAVGWRSSPIQEKLSGLKIEGLKELEALTNDMVHMIETAPVPILAVDVDGMVNGWNTKIAELTGISIDDAIGKPMLTLVEESSIYVVEKMLDLALRGKEEHNVYFELKTHVTLADSGPVSLVVNACTSKDADQNVVGVCFVAQDITDQKTIMDKFTRIEGDYKAIIESPSLLIPPIFGADEFGWCSEWNPAMSALSGFSREEVIDKMILGEVFGTHKACCRLKDQEAFIRLGVLLNDAMTGHESEKSSFGFISRSGMYIECLLSINMKMNKEGAVTGIFCFLQLASQELQHALFVQRLSEKTALRSLKMLSYMKRQVRNPLGGIKFSQKLLDGTKISEEQKHLFNTSSSCQRQLAKILDDTDLEGLIDGYLNLEMVEFTLGDVLTTSVSQVMIKSNLKDIEIINDSKDEILSVTFYGDGLRLQQVVADFLLLSVNFSQDSGTISMGASFVKKYLAENFYLAQLELRISWKVKGEGESEQMLEKMIENEEEGSEEGVSVQISRKLVKLMNGDVHYLKQTGTATIIISVELPLISSYN